MNYNHIHRTLLQAFLSHGMLEKEKASDILKAICENAQVSPLNLEETVNQINQKIRFLEQQVVSVDFDLTDKAYFVFKTTVGPEVNELQTIYTAGEVEYFKNLMKELVSNDSYQIKPISAVNVVDTVADKRPSKMRAECLIDTWSQEGYFHKTDDAIYIGPRALIQFHDFLTANAEGLTTCQLCSVIQITGMQCADCNTLFHKNCMRKYLQSSTNCPKCKKLWKVPIY